nr:MAG TPA: hypothetical protein [Bacteriophage sp.]
MTFTRSTTIDFAILSPHFRFFRNICLFLHLFYYNICFCQLPFYNFCCVCFVCVIC